MSSVQVASFTVKHFRTIDANCDIGRWCLYSLLADRDGEEEMARKWCGNIDSYLGSDQFLYVSKDSTEMGREMYDVLNSFGVPGYIEAEGICRITVVFSKDGEYQTRTYFFTELESLLKETAFHYAGKTTLYRYFGGSFYE